MLINDNATIVKLMLKNKIQWVLAEDDKEYLVIPKDFIKNITDKLQGVKIIETLPNYEV